MFDIHRRTEKVSGDPESRCVADARSGRRSQRLCSLLGRLVLLGILAVMFLGCSAANPDTDDLASAIDDYHQALTWGRYGDAANFLPPAQRNEFIGFYEESEDNVHFTEFSVGSVDMGPENEEATVLVTLSWYAEASYTVQETRVRETWVYDEEVEIWILTERTDPDEDD